ncbi:MAG TPA: sensor histidine kinase [Lachnospiraceae bacterium]|nr:sensor histidine kinase [Lachnospiraceae bacterium]
MTESRKQSLIVLLSVLLGLAGIICLSVFWLRVYRQTVFTHMSAFCEIVIEEHPDMEGQVLAALKEYHGLMERGIKENQFLAQYGYGSSMLCENIPWGVFGLPTVCFCLSACSFLLSAWYGKRRRQRRIVELTGYLEQVNTGRAGLQIRGPEDEFSRLQDEIYKTVTFLYQTREAAVKARENFADNLANIAHQLKTPITAAFLSLQLMAETAPSIYGQQIGRQLRRLERLEEALLTLSKMDAGTLKLAWAPVDIYTVLNLAAEELEELLAEKYISVDIPDRGAVSFNGDMEWTLEGILNLMKNCLEHSASGSTIYCEYSETPFYAEILLWDEGEGFWPEDIPRLFERFYRGKDAAGEGIGIGLSLSRSIFELQNGTITARNRPTGGACFEIRMYRH